MASNDPGPSSQWFYQDKNFRVPSPRGPPLRNVNNLSIQTGEEFLTDFSRNPNGMLGLRRKDSDASLEVSEPEIMMYPYNVSRYKQQYSGYPQALGQMNHNFHEQVSLAPTISQMYMLESPRSYQHYSMQGGVTEDAFPWKIKFLCSFGGRILPRPGDGKLRYVGGETRILSIRQDVTLDELAKKTALIFKVPHVMKYQLPGEDLDALISVCSDEDLRNMIEEYRELEKCGGSQRLRLFLIGLNELESDLSSSEAKTLQQSDTDYQYVSAVNNMVERSPQNSCGPSQGTQQAIASEFTPNFHMDASTSGHAFENKDYGPNSPRIKGRFSNHAARGLPMLQIPVKTFNQSPPVSPSQLQKPDPRSSHVKFYVGIPYNDSNETINHPFIAEKHLLHSPNYYVEGKTGQNNDLHTQNQPRNYNHYNQQFVESGPSTRMREMNYHNRTPSGDFTPTALHGRSNMKHEKSMFKERAYSDPQLQEHDEQMSHHLDGAMPHAPRGNGIHTSNSSQELAMQCQEHADDMYKATRHEYHPKFKRPCYKDSYSDQQNGTRKADADYLPPNSSPLVLGNFARQTTGQRTSEETTSSQIHGFQDTSYFKAQKSSREDKKPVS